MRLFAIASCLLVAAHVATAAPPQRSPTSKADAEAAAGEGALVVYGSTSERFARYLVDEFKARHPAIAVTYVALPPEQLDARMRREDGASAGPDVVWSSAMDLQMKAALDGLAQPYHSAEASSLPAWAKWRDRLYATTYEPLVLVYNRQLVVPVDVPTTHQKLRERLVSESDKYHGKVATYAQDNVELGSWAFQLDAKQDPRFWDLLHAMRAAGLDEESSSSAILDRVSSGQSLIAYNVSGTEAIRRARRDPLVGVQFTLDYNLVTSRVLFIAQHAPHPNAARLWVDFMLSKQGQQQMQIADLIPIREDVSGVDGGLLLLRQARGVAKPVALDAKLADLCSPGAVKAFRERWRTSLGGAVIGPRSQQISTLSARWLRAANEPARYEAWS